MLLFEFNFFFLTLQADESIFVLHWEVGKDILASAFSKLRTNVIIVILHKWWSLMQYLTISSEEDIKNHDYYMNIPWKSANSVTDFKWDCLFGAFDICNGPLRVYRSCCLHSTLPQEDVQHNIDSLPNYNLKLPEFISIDDLYDYCFWMSYNN